MPDVKIAAPKKKVVPAKPAKKKKENVFKRLGKYFKEVVSEVKKITWPSKKEYLNHVLVVFVFVLIMTFIIFGMNTILTFGLKLLLGTT